MAKVDNIEREKFHNQFYKAIERFLYHPNLKVAYLAMYGLQIFSRVKDDETTLHAILRHGFHVVKGLYSLYKIYEGAKKIELPIRHLVQAGKSSKQPQLINEGKTLVYRLIFFASNDLGDNIAILGCFLKLVEEETIKKVAAKIADEFHTHNPFFVVGLVELLKEVLNQYGAYDQEVAQQAIQLLERIGLDNSSSNRMAYSKSSLDSGRSRSSDL